MTLFPDMGNQELPDSHKAVILVANELSNYSNIVVVIDMSHKIIWGDLQLEEHTGFKLYELIGKDLNLVIPFDVHDKHLDFVTKFLSNPNCARKMALGRTIDLRGRDDRLTPVRITLHHYKYSPTEIDENTIENFGIATMIPSKKEKTGDIKKTTEVEQSVLPDERGYFKTFTKTTEYADQNKGKIINLAMFALIAIGIYGLYLVVLEIPYLIHRDVPDYEQQRK